jgi:hypothetical protein
MKKITFILSFIILLTSCGVKQTQTMLSDGDYDGAINRATESLRTQKNAKGKQDYVYLLEEAFAKAKERDLREIDMLVKDGNPAKIERIYALYWQLNSRQEKIRPLLPIQLIKEGRPAVFPFDDYSNQITNTKNTLSQYLYTNSKALLLTNDKLSYRKAYDNLAYLESINPNFKDSKKYMDEALFKGTNFVSVTTKNETNMVIPSRLQQDLLNFSSYGINDKWTVYHNSKQKGTNYDYSMIVSFRQIVISPEQIKEREFVKEKEIKDGQKTVLDARGVEVKDSKGNPVMVDNLKTVRVSIYEFKQFKSCQVTAKVDYIDNRNNQLINTFPLISEFVFDHIYASSTGDRRACEENYMPYFSKKAVPFPSNEQMVYDTGEDLKIKLKDIISRNRLN